MSINRVDICLSRSPERPVLISGLVLSSRHASACEVRAQLRALGVRPRPRVPRLRSPGGWDSLTGTERAVSLLVAGGLANGCGGSLYISPHTVNTPLRHVFAELGVPDRTALAAVVSRSIKRCLGRRHNRARAVGCARRSPSARPGRGGPVDRLSR